jgi:hypothetical protein
VRLERPSAGISAQSLGAFPLKGVGIEQEIFAPILDRSDRHDGDD